MAALKPKGEEALPWPSGELQRVNESGTVREFMFLGSLVRVPFALLPFLIRIGP